MHRVYRALDIDPLLNDNEIIMTTNNIIKSKNLKLELLKSDISFNQVKLDILLPASYFYSLQNKLNKNYTKIQNLPQMHRLKHVLAYLMYIINGVLSMVLIIS